MTMVNSPFFSVEPPLSRKKRVKAVSPLIATVLLLGLAFAIAALVGPWAFDTARGITERKANESAGAVMCQSGTYDFDSSWNGTGIGLNVSGTGDSISAKIVNTGYQSLHNFTFIVTVNQTSSVVIKEFTANETTQRTASTPLRPGERTVLGAALTEDITGRVTRVGVVSAVCPENGPERSV